MTLNLAIKKCRDLIPPFQGKHLNHPASTPDKLLNAADFEKNLNPCFFKSFLAGIILQIVCSCCLEICKADGI